MPGRLFVAGVDDSETSMTAAIWAALNLATRPGDALHLLFTLPPPTFYAAPTGPWPAAGAAAFGATLAQKEEDEHLARATLARVKRQIQAQAPEVEVHTHALPAAGGASGAWIAAASAPLLLGSAAGLHLFWSRFGLADISQIIHTGCCSAPPPGWQGWASRSSSGRRRSRRPRSCWARGAWAPSSRRS